MLRAPCRSFWVHSPAICPHLPTSHLSLRFEFEPSHQLLSTSGILCQDYMSISVYHNYNDYMRFTSLHGFYNFQKTRDVGADLVLQLAAITWLHDLTHLNCTNWISHRFFSLLVAHCACCNCSCGHHGLVFIARCWMNKLSMAQNLVRRSTQKLWWPPNATGKQAHSWKKCNGVLEEQLVTVWEILLAS